MDPQYALLRLLLMSLDSMLGTVKQDQQLVDWMTELVDDNTETDRNGWNQAVTDHCLLLRSQGCESRLENLECIFLRKEP